MSDDLDRNEEFARFHVIIDANNSLWRARMRCEPTASLIAEIADVQSPGSYYVCRTLGERGLTDNERAEIAKTVRLVLSDDFRQQVLARVRPKLDRLLLHSSKLMHNADARSLAHEQLQHTRAARRTVAVRVLHRLGVMAADMASARAALATYDEAEAIALLAILPGGLQGFDCCRLIRLCDGHPAPFGDESYLGAVALQGLANEGALDHTHACVAHPLSYIRVAARHAAPYSKEQAFSAPLLATRVTSSVRPSSNWRATGRPTMATATNSSASLTAPMLNLCPCGGP